jgi:transcriptional regulator with XRE-family HTH domain
MARAARQERRVLGRNVRRLRKKRGWSQEHLAAEAGELRQALISQIETGRANPTFDTLEYVAAALGVRVYDLLKPVKGQARRPRA